MTVLRLLGLGGAYGFAFALIKSIFPIPIVLLVFQGEGGGPDGNLTTLVVVYTGVGLLAGLVAAPLFGGLLLFRRSRRPSEPTGTPRFALSMALALMMGVFSGLLTIGAYAAGLLPTGGVLDPLSIIRASNFAPGTPLLVAWTIVRDLLPAGLVGLFLAPLGGGMLLSLYAPTEPVQKQYDEDL